MQLVGYLPNEARVFEGELGAEGDLHVWLGGKTYFGRVRFANGKAAKLGFTLRVIFRPQLWLALWKARKPREHLTELEASRDVIVQLGHASARRLLCPPNRTTHRATVIGFVL